MDDQEWGDEVMLTVCNALGIHPDAVDRDDDTEALGILRDLCEQKAERLALLEEVASNVRDVLDGYPAHQPRCPCSLCLLHVAMEGV